MNDVAIQKIFECLEEDLYEPERNWPEKSFEDRSYSRWAAMEIWEKLMDHPHDDPNLIIEEYMFKMLALSKTTTDPMKSRIFSLASETAEDILSVF